MPSKTKSTSVKTTKKVVLKSEQNKKPKSFVLSEASEVITKVINANARTEISFEKFLGSFDHATILELDKYLHHDKAPLRSRWESLRYSCRR